MAPACRPSGQPIHGKPQERCARAPRCARQGALRQRGLIDGNAKAPRGQRRNGPGKARPAEIEPIPRGPRLPKDTKLLPKPLQIPIQHAEHEGRVCRAKPRRAAPFKGKVQRMPARTRQCFCNRRDFREQGIAITRQPMARSPIRQGEARRGIARARAAPECFRAHWRGAHGGKRWLGFGTQIENGNGGQQWCDLLTRCLVIFGSPVCYPR